MGQPVHITRGGDRGARLSAGVVCWAGGRRAHVVEPQPGDTYAPGLANSAGIVDTAEWVAMGLHTALLARARDAGRVQPRQTGPGYTILEFARCSDGRWHEIDSFGRKLATVADLLDADDLVDALRSTDVDAEDEGEDEPTVESVVEETVQEIVEQVERFTELRRSVAKVTAGAEKTPVVSDEDVRVRVASPDDEDVNRRVRSMQSALRRTARREDVAVSEVDFENVIVEDDENDAEETETIVGLGRFEGTAAAEERPPSRVLAARALTADEALERARGVFAEQSKARSRARSRVDRLRHRRSRASGDPASGGGERDQTRTRTRTREIRLPSSPSRRRASREGRRTRRSTGSNPWRPRGAIFDAEEAAQLQLELDAGAGFVTRALDERERSRVSLNDDNVLVIAWVDKDDGEGRQPGCSRFPKVPPPRSSNRGSPRREDGRGDGRRPRGGRRGSRQRQHADGEFGHAAQTGRSGVPRGLNPRRATTVDHHALVAIFVYHTSVSPSRVPVARGNVTGRRSFVFHLRPAAAYPF